MEWKTYFTDGLIQIAILLSLFRTDWNDYLNSSLYDGYPEIQEIIMGPLSGYTQTYIHANEWHAGLISISHPKSITLDHPTSVFGDIHSLGRCWQLDGIRTNIDAFLVSAGTQCRLDSERAHASQPHVTADTNSQTEQSSQNNQSHHVNNLNSPVVEGAVGPDVNDTRLFSFEIPGSELTKEDMDLIEILWRQDIDLGVDREAFDSLRRLELEKQRENELLQQREKEKELEKQRQEHESGSDLNVTFVLDRETGELIPATRDASDLVPSEPFVPFTHQQMAPQGSMLAVGESVVPRGRPLQSSLLSQHLTDNQQGLPQVGPIVQPITPAVSQQQDDFPIDTSLPMLEDTGMDDFDLTCHNDPENCPIIRQLNELDGIVPDTSSVQNDNAQQPPMQHQTSIEQRWEDISSILPLPEGADDQRNNNSSSNSSNIATERAIAELAMLLEEQNGTSDCSTLVENSLINNTTLTPHIQNNSLSFAEDLAVAQPVNQEVTEPLHLVSADSLGLTNESTSTTTQYINSTATLLQQLLRDDIALDLNELNISDGTVSMETTDSSVSEQTTPEHVSNDVQSDVLSPFDALEGATGGGDVESAAAGGYSGFETKHKPKSEHMYNQMSFDNNEICLNHSDGSNASLSSTEAKADLGKVSHNHTYPLQPGQAPKERRSQKLLREEMELHDAQYTRDEKRAKAMNIPLTMDEMINSPVEHFNELLQSHQLTDAQLQLIRDIRRRGKNKVAAQNCRKRKMEVLQSLEEEVEKMRQERDQLQSQRRGLDKEMAAMRQKYSQLYDDVFRKLVDDHGHPYDPSQYILQQNENGELFLIPHNATSCIKDEPKGKTSRKRKHDRKGR